MQSENVIPKSEDYSSDEFLAVFTMPGDYVNVPPSPAPSTSSLGHRRNRSSDSVCSFVDRSQPTARMHGSLPYARASPNTPSISLPGQDRRYLSASAVPPAYTTPATPPNFATRNRQRASPSEEEDEDYVEDLPPDATDQERAAHKRRLNTLAARRSRRRRQAEFQRLQDDVARITKDRDIWKERALMLARMMSASGMSYPPFPGV